MDGLNSLKVAAEAASIVARLNPEVPDELIGDMIAATMELSIEGPDTEGEVLAETVASSVHDDLLRLKIGSYVALLIAQRVEGLDATKIDVESTIDTFGLTADDVDFLRKDLSETFGIDPESIDLESNPMMHELVDAIADAMPDDDSEPGTCSHGVCGCAGSSPAYKERQEADIARLGFTYAPVLPGNDSAGFIYSIGLSEQDKVDLLFIGDFTPPTYDYLGMFVAMQMEGRELPFGLVSADDPMNGFGVPIWVVPADEKLGTHAFGAVTRLQRIESDKSARLAQIVMPDRQNRFPWDDGYDWLDQEVTRPATA